MLDIVSMYWYIDTMIESLAGVLLLCTSVAWLISATRAEPMLGWFCFQYDVPDSMTARSLVRAYLFRTRVWRVLGAGAGFVVPLAVVTFSDAEISLVISIGVGWLAAGLVAEMTGRRRRRHGPTVASMWTTSDLVSPAARHTIAATSLMTVLALMLAFATRYSPMVLREGVPLPTAARELSVCAATLLLAAITYRGLRSNRTRAVPDGRQRPRPRRTRHPRRFLRSGDRRVVGSPVGLRRLVVVADRRHRALAVLVAADRARRLQLPGRSSGVVVDADSQSSSRRNKVARIVNLEVDTRSAVPPYEQIRVRVTELISRGALVPGDRLPTVRQLAVELGVAPGTVQRAYRELELIGVIQSRGRHGTVVSEEQRSRLPRDRRQALRRAASQFIEFAQSIGAQPPEIDEALDAARR